MKTYINSVLVSCLEGKEKIIHFQGLCIIF